MKFTFKIQQFQTDAVNSVIRVFQGQPYNSGVSYRRDMGIKNEPEQLAFGENTDEEDGFGYKNEVVHLTQNQILENIRIIQADRNIHQSNELVDPLGSCSLDVEMETGTGKTYVYIKTIFELNKLYGWSKFIVVVPSLAIREGVKKSFQMMEDHFMEQYGKKARWFVYDSSNLNQLDSFSSDAGIHVMIINMQAFNTSLNEDKNVEGRKGDKAARIIYSKRDEFGSRRPIDVIAANHPILIMDEPQKMGGIKTQKALRQFKPLFTLNYSATHAKQHNLVYVLDAVDAFNERLVKKIQVKGIKVKNLTGTNQYLYLEDILISPDKPPRARLELEVSHKSGIKREKHILNTGDNLYYTSHNLEQYKDFVISEIDPLTATVTFTNGDVIKKGDVTGDVSEQDLRRVQIRETIRSHFEKEQQLFKMGIKTLSLFFIDEVAKYRQYDEDGNEVLGEYGQIFEQEYIDVLNENRNFYDPDYLKYLDSVDVHQVHNGYFSIDKKGRAINSTTKKGSEFSDDISAYDLILKNKERLLSFEEPTRFIFSHSALREGWDNPNVFQICTLKHSDSNTQRRQEVGRGLRLCVDQQGNRMDVQACGDNVQNINVLTVIANESYETFVSGLQSEMKEDLYDRPRKASLDYFLGKTVRVGDRQIELDEKQARAIYQYLVRNSYVDEDDNVTREYREEAENNQLKPLPESLQPMEDSIHKLVQSIFDDSVLNSMVEDANKTKIQENPLNERFYKKEFQNFWNEINHKYAYTVQFDSNELIQKSVKAIDDELTVTRLRYTVTEGEQQDKLNTEQVKSGESFSISKTQSRTLEQVHGSQVKYDLIGKIAEGTVLTRRTVATILERIQPDKFAMYKLNPEEFISKVTKLITDQKATMIVEHITYNQIDGSYDSSIFTAERHSVPYDQAYRAKKSIQDYVFTDGTAEKSVERRFAEDLDHATEVCEYAKLPKGFNIPTPVGHYSPDWAIVFHEGEVKHIYFIAETKGTMDSMNLRAVEKAKIDCVDKLFNTMSAGKITFGHVDSYQQLLDIVEK